MESLHGHRLAESRGSSSLRALHLQEQRRGTCIPGRGAWGERSQMRPGTGVTDQHCQHGVGCSVRPWPRPVFLAAITPVFSEKLLLQAGSQCVTPCLGLLPRDLCPQAPSSGSPWSVLNQQPGQPAPVLREAHYPGCPRYPGHGPELVVQLDKIERVA